MVFSTDGLWSAHKRKRQKTPPVAASTTLASRHSKVVSANIGALFYAELLKGSMPHKALLNINTEHSYFLERALRDLNRDELIKKRKGSGCSPISNHVLSNMYHGTYYSALHIDFSSAVLHTHNHGDDNRALLRFHKQEAGDVFGEIFARHVQVRCARVFHRLFDGLADDEARLIHEVFVVAQIDESARDDVGRFVESARAAVDSRDDDAKSFLAKRLAVAHEDVGEFGTRVSFDDAQL